MVIWNTALMINFDCRSRQTGPMLASLWMQEGIISLSVTHFSISVSESLSISIVSTVSVSYQLASVSCQMYQYQYDVPTWTSMGITVIWSAWRISTSHENGFSEQPNRSLMSNWNWRTLRMKRSWGAPIWRATIILSLIRQTISLDKTDLRQKGDGSSYFRSD